MPNDFEMVRNPLWGGLGASEFNEGADNAGAGVHMNANPLHADAGLEMTANPLWGGHGASAFNEAADNDAGVHMHANPLAGHLAGGFHEHESAEHEGGEHEEAENPYKQGLDGIGMLHDVPDAVAGVSDAFTHTEGLEGLSKVMANPAMRFGGAALGGVLGGINAYKGFKEWQGGNKTQGGMDMVAGGTGVAAAGLSTLAGLGVGGAALAGVGAVAAPVAVAAGLAAAGNDWTKKQGWWGKNADGSNRDSLQFVGQSTSSAYNSVNKWAGGGWKGKIAGGLAGAGTALGTGALALGGDLVGGVAATGQGLWNGAKAVGGLASRVGSGIASGIGGAAKKVGSFVSHLW